MNLIDSPAVKVKVPSHNQLQDSSDDVRVQHAAGVARSGGNDRHDSPVQAEPDSAHGAQDARERKPESKGVTEGHHVTAGGDPDGNRVNYVNSEYARKDEKTASPSGRVPLKTMAAKSDGV